MTRSAEGPDTGERAGEQGDFTITWGVKKFEPPKYNVEKRADGWWVVAEFGAIGTFDTENEARLAKKQMEGRAY